MARRSEARERKPKADCPSCGHWDSLVVGGRYDELNQVYIRYRRCQLCRERFETEERVRRRVAAATRLSA